MQHPFQSAAVAQVFEHYPANARHQLLALRDLIFKTASNTAGVGQIEETLKWGEPAYLTPDSKSGSTIRIAWKKSAPSLRSMYFNCNTSLVDTFRTLSRPSSNSKATGRLFLRCRRWCQRTHRPSASRRR